MVPDLINLGSGEIYLGYQRAAGFVSPEGILSDTSRDYSVTEPGLNEWGLTGRWTIAFLARSQVFAAKKAFTAKANDPAWKVKKSWSIVATRDRSINPELERDMAKRAGSTVTEIEASHAVFASLPEKVADVVDAAARTLGE